MIARLGRAVQGGGGRGLLLLQVERELPLLGQRRAAHLHAQAPGLGRAAVQAQVAAHVSQLGVALDLLPFLRKTEIVLGSGRGREGTKQAHLRGLLATLKTKEPSILGGGGGGL